jgi:hypothetical protein
VGTSPSQSSRNATPPSLPIIHPLICGIVATKTPPSQSSRNTTLSVSALSVPRNERSLRGMPHHPLSLHKHESLSQRHIKMSRSSHCNVTTSVGTRTPPSQSSFAKTRPSQSSSRNAMKTPPAQTPQKHHPLCLGKNTTLSVFLEERDPLGLHKHESVSQRHITISHSNMTTSVGTSPSQSS